MASSTLFGYTLEEQDDKLVITVHGAFAETAVKYIREELSQGRGLRLIQRLSPLGPLGSLMNRRDEEQSETGDDTTPPGQVILDADQILHQGMDQSLEAFELEMAQFKAALDNSKKDTGAPRAKGGK